MSTTTSNMGLVVPAIAVDSGPTWAAGINASLSIIDSHNHSSGQGVQITPNGININSDLTFGSNNATALRSARFTAQVSALATVSDVGCLYVVGNELYYNDVTGGHHIPITASGSVNAGAGSISGLPSGTAGATYSAGTFVWTSATSTAANMDAGTYTFRNSGASSNGLTLQAPSMSGGSTVVTLPAIPAGLSLMALDASGNMSAPYSISAGLNASVLTNASITTTQMGAASVGTTQLVAGSVTPAKRSALGQQVSSSCGTYIVVGGGGFTAVTNLSVTITTTGRPVHVGLMGDRGGSSGGIGVTGGNIDLQLTNNGTQFQFYNMAGNVFIPSSAITCMDTPAAGTYTYALQARLNSTSGSINNCVLYAYEL